MLTVLIIVVGCTSPTPTFFAAISTDVTVENSRFRVYHFPGGGNVEAHRISFEFLPGWSATRTRAVQAIESATGCFVRPGSVSGDPSILKAKVNCFSGSLF